MKKDNGVDLKGKVVVVTGASSGFGKGAARKFAAEGATVVLAARREHLLDELAAECESAGGTAMVVPTDVSLESDVEALAKAAVSHNGRIDVWVNNAGSGAIGRFTDIPLEVHRGVIDTDLLGTLYGSYFAMKRFQQQKAGILINIASVVGKVPEPYYSSYVAAKFAVAALSASLRQELAANHIETIHVCTVLPAAFDTPFFEHAANYSGHQFEPSGPIYDPKEVVEAIVQLAREPKDETPVGTAASLAIFAHKFMPGLLESRMGSDTKKKLDKAPSLPHTEGSVLEPVATGTGVTGSKRR